MLLGLLHYRTLMSSQLIELIIFAAVAFFIISKLISVLGTTTEDDPARQKKSYFGEPAGLKDVTGAEKKGYKEGKIINASFTDIKNRINLKGLIVPENKDSITEGLKQVNARIPSFSPDKFLKGAKLAFKMIIEKAVNNNSTDLGELIDKRYMKAFQDFAFSYGNYQPSATLNVQISEIYMFGNNAFVKVVFTGENITDKISNLYEEWTFTKSLLSSGPEWYLSNIDRLQ